MTLLPALFIGLFVVPGAALAETRLMMVEQAGCSYCAAWHADVGPEYAKTAEGLAAPLMPQDLRAALPEGVTLASPPVFTPTFVLLRDGVETGRIEGYPGEDFFWPLLADLIAKANEG
jgi:hypothetical protein